MHSGKPPGGEALLLQLGRLMVRSRSRSRSPAPQHRDRLLQAKLIALHLPSTSKQVVTQPRSSDDLLELSLVQHIHALWNDQTPLYIDVALGPDCGNCGRARRGLLIERWVLTVLSTKAQEAPAFITSQWLVNAVRSQLHFSQLSAWLSTLKSSRPPSVNDEPRRRRYDPERNLNIIYSIVTGDSLKNEFSKTPTDHTFPITDLGSDLCLKVVLQSLPRISEIPRVHCICEVPQDDLAARLDDLNLAEQRGKGASFSPDLGVINSNIGSSSCVTRRLSIFSNPSSEEYLYSRASTPDRNEEIEIEPKTEPNYPVDDRMLTPCSESGKHKCNCDDESDQGNNRSSTNIRTEPELDERRIREIAKYKRRLRKESKLRKLRESGTSDTTSEGDSTQREHREHTSIPILQASRFDRFRALGRYRKTYTVPPRLDISQDRKMTSVATQTDPTCNCGNEMRLRCDLCDKGRSENGLDRSQILLDAIRRSTRRPPDEGETAMKKYKCDNNSICDKISSKVVDNIIKKPKLKRLRPIVDRIDKIVSDRHQKDIDDLLLRDDDSVFALQTLTDKSDEGEVYQKDDDEKSQLSDELEQNSSEVQSDGPESPELDKMKWRFDSASSMVFHTKTGLPLTSSPAPLRRGNNCFDYDDTITGISGIKSAFFPPVSPCSIVSSAPAARPRTITHTTSRPLLGSFEESALKGRLRPVAAVGGFTARLGACGARCPPHRTLPATVYFYAPGGTSAPYMGHIKLGSQGYLVSRSGTIQVSLFNPHGTLVKMFVVLYDLSAMPPGTRTFLRQRTYYMPVGEPAPPVGSNRPLRYLIHLRFLTSKSGKLYLHTDIRVIISRKADLDTATAHAAIFKPIAANDSAETPLNELNPSTNKNEVFSSPTNHAQVFGCSDSELVIGRDTDDEPGVAYELRSFTYAPDNPKYSPK